MTPPFRADHVGSLLRPAALKQAFRDHGAGRIDDQAFVRIQDEPACRVEDQTDRRTHPQFPLFRSGQFAAEQAVAEPVKFGLAHGAEDAQ